MKLKLLNMNKFIHGLTPVTSTELKSKSGEFNPKGLFSEIIFGIENSLNRSKKYSYINLNAKIIHPAAFKLLIRIDRRIEKMIITEQSFSVDSEGQLILDEKGVTGINGFIELFPKIKLRTGTSTREKIIKVIEDAYKQGSLFIDTVPIIPPDFRPMYIDESGNVVMDELNEIYINIMRKASQVKSVGKGSALFDLLNYYLQNVVNDHDKYIRTKISKKSGLIRNNMLGKRVDFSARAVITPGPDLNVNQIGVPLRICVSLFQPFLIHYILFSKRYPHKEELTTEIKNYTDSEVSVDTINRVIKSIKTGDKIPQNLYNLFFEACEIVMKGRVVLAKRDPALHDGSYRAFYPVLVNGNTIQICTLQVGSFNADFDGDQMGLFHPLTRQAQQEAKDKMMNGRGSKHSSHVTYEISKEMVVGLYIMTKSSKKTNSPLAINQNDIDKAIDPFIIVKYKGHITTLGRAIFNNAFPSDWPFMDDLVTKKYVNKLISKIIDKYGDQVAIEVFSKLEKIGFKFATIMAPSITIDNLEMPDSIMRLKSKIANSSPEEADKILKEAEKLMIEYLKDTGLYDLVESGAGKGWGQPRQILIAKGVIADPKGNPLPPIQGSFADGLSTTEFFSAASGARKGMADRALNTATTGYFTRQLVYVLGPAEASPTLNDCKTKRVITLRLTKDIMGRLKGRYVVRGGNLYEFDASKYAEGDSINLRSPIYCESSKFCHTCYGKLLLRHKTPYVGILAGASIGERGTQLIMQSFHLGGKATFATHDMLQEILDNDPLINVDLKKYLFQDEDKLVTLKPVKISIDLTNYHMGDNIQINEDHVWINHLMAKVEYDNIIFNLMLDYAVQIKKINMEIINKEIMEFTYTENDIIIEVPLATEEIKAQVNYINRLLGGKVVFKDPSHMITKVMKVYGGAVSDLDLVHFEVLISQVLRDRTHPILPARMGQVWDPIMMNIKKAVFSSGFISGLGFENISSAIEYGLISEGELEPSVLGRLISGEVITK